MNSPNLCPNCGTKIRVSRREYEDGEWDVQAWCPKCGAEWG